MRAGERVAILTGGGDCPGINAVIRAVVKKATRERSLEVIGIEDGYEGLIENRHRPLAYDDVAGILTLGGTILGTSNTANPYSYAVKENGELLFKDRSSAVLRNVEELNISCLVCIGGDGTLSIASSLFQQGVPVVGIPKTIDNDLRGTDITFGFNTAVEIATEGIDRIHTTAQSHHRVMIVEVMGRDAGWIALNAGIAGGGDIILIPEIPFRIDSIARKVQERSKKGRRSSIIVVAEGARPKGGGTVTRRLVPESTDPVRLGGVGFVLGQQIEEVAGIETRTVVMGHLQRGGVPTAFDRTLATRLGTKAVDLIGNHQFGTMVGVKGDTLVSVPLSIAAGGVRVVPLDHPLIQSARSVGTCFGD